MVCVLRTMVKKKVKRYYKLKIDKKNKHGCHYYN